MYKKMVLFIGLVIPLTSNAEDESFIRLEQPKIEISVPLFPQVEMKSHHSRSISPHFQVEGSLKLYTVTVLTPTADYGMTVDECANATANKTIDDNGLSNSASRLYNLNPTTKMFFYVTDHGGIRQTHAHLLSAYKGLYCINMHISRPGNDQNAIDDLFHRFGGAYVRPYG